MVINLSNSVHIQWGNYVVTATETLTWPISFASTFYCVATSAMHSSATNYYTLNRFPYSCTKSGFSHTKASSTDGHIYYIAVGK